MSVCGAERLSRSIQLQCEVAAGDCSISLTIRASIGVAVQQKDRRTADALIKSADGAMYHAKQGASRDDFA